MNSQYNFSYSGSDVKALIKNTDLNTAYKVLNTLTTVSFSVNEQKTPVRRLGRRHVVGFTKAIRTIAGTMVLTVLKGHPLTELYKLNEFYKTGEMGQGVHRPNSYYFSTNVPPFDLKLIYQTEHNSRYYAELVIKGIEIISQSIVTSVNDMVTECVLQFVAKDYNEFMNHVSNVTEDTHAKIIAKTQVEEIKIKEETDNLNQADSLAPARELVTPQDIRTMVEYLENLRTTIPENVKSAISKFNDIHFDLLKKQDTYYKQVEKITRAEAKQRYEEYLQGEARLEEFRNRPIYEYEEIQRGYMGTVPEDSPDIMPSFLSINEVSLENLKQEQIQDYLHYLSYIGETNMTIPTSSQQEEREQLINGLTKAEQDLIEEKGTFESEEERTARYNRNDTNGI